MKAFLPTLGLCSFLLSSTFSRAETIPHDSVIGMLAAEAQWLPAANRIAAKLDHENGLRIVPMLGAGGVQAIQDLANLPMVDVAIISSDSLIYAAQQDLLRGQIDKFSYVARLDSLEVVLVARRDIRSVADLAGKHIATGPAQSATFATGELLFNAMNISFSRVAKQDEAAIDALNSGQADAALFLGTELSTAALSDGRFHVLSLQIPASLSKIYQPAILTTHNLPGLIIGNQNVETFSTSLALAVYDRPRDLVHTKALQNFETMIFKLSAGDRSGNLAAAVPGWKRHADAQKILNQTQAANIQRATITPAGGKP